MLIFCLFCEMNHIHIIKQKGGFMTNLLFRNVKGLLGLSFFVVGLVLSYPNHSFATDGFWGGVDVRDNYKCKIKAYNLEDNDQDTYISILSDSMATQAETWITCYDRALTMAETFSNMWDDSNSQFGIHDRHIYFVWVWVGDAWKSRTSSGYVNKYTSKIAIENGKLKGNQIYDQNGSLIIDK